MNQSSLPMRFLTWLRRLFGLEPRRPAPTLPDSQTVPQRPGPVTRKVLLAIINPILPSERGRKLVEVLGWNQPDRLVSTLIKDLREVSRGYVNFEVVEQVELTEFPRKEDGFRYTPAEFLRCWSLRRGFHQPDAIDYHLLLDQLDVIDKINAGTIDEVWTVSFPYCGFYESRMAGPGAFWCNAPPLRGTDDADRLFVIMGFNYERGVGEMLESFGHRAESILEQVFRLVPEPENLWKRFTRFDQMDPGHAEVGTIHYAPNSSSDYDWGNPRPVWSRCRNWRNFPNLSGEPALMDCREWGSGDIRAHHRWWFSLLPHILGKFYGISNNWWEYMIDPNRVP